MAFQTKSIHKAPGEPPWEQALVFAVNAPDRHSERKTWTDYNFAHRVFKAREVARAKPSSPTNESHTRRTTKRPSAVLTACSPSEVTQQILLAAFSSPAPGPPARRRSAARKGRGTAACRAWGRGAPPAAGQPLTRLSRSFPRGGSRLVPGLQRSAAATRPPSNPPGTPQEPYGSRARHVSPRPPRGTAAGTAHLTWAGSARGSDSRRPPQRCTRCDAARPALSGADQPTLPGPAPRAAQATNQPPGAGYAVPSRERARARGAVTAVAARGVLWRFPPCRPGRVERSPGRSFRPSRRGQRLASFLPCIQQLSGCPGGKSWPEPRVIFMLNPGWRPILSLFSCFFLRASDSWSMTHKLNSLRRAVQASHR